MSAVNTLITSPEHIHVGAGSFGLGMVVDICHRRANFRTAVLSQYSGKEHQDLLRAQQSYAVVFDGDPEHREILKINLHYYAKEDHSKAVELLASPSVGLITTSVGKENLRTVSALLARAFEKRKQNGIAGKLCVVACENLSQNSTELRTYVESHLTPDGVLNLQKEVFFCNSLVDRICSPISCRSGMAEIPAESFHDWILTSPASSVPLLDILKRKRLIRFAHSELEFKAYELQKYWCMNGLHLATAAYAYNSKKDLPHFSQALAFPFLSKKVQALQNELALAFLLYVRRNGLRDRFSEPAVRRYNKRLFQRLRLNATDTVGRILKLEKGLPNAVLELLARIDRLIGPQCEILAFRKKLKTPEQKLVAFHARGDAKKRLELDDAIQHVVIAMRDFAERYEILKTASR